MSAPGEWLDRRFAIGWLLLALGSVALLSSPLMGYEPAFLALFLFVAGIIVLLIPRPLWRGSPDVAPPSATWRAIALALAGLLGAGAIGAGAYVGNIVQEPRIALSEEVAACRPFAAVSPEDAVRRVTARSGMDLWEGHFSVAPRFLNRTGEYEVLCGQGPMPSAFVQRLPVDTYAAENFAWLVGYTHDYELLGGLAWIDWDTGVCLVRC